MVATGIRDNKGEGGNDVFVCHFDNQGEVTLEETLGSIENDKANHSASHPLKPALFFTGYHKGYGVETSGNAYVSGVLFQDLESLFTGSCEVPRYMFVDNLVQGRNVNSGLIEKEILGSQSKTNDLINYCNLNNIDFISIYKLGFLFDNYWRTIPCPFYLQYIVDDRNFAINQLDSFITKCHNNQIRVGYIADRDSLALREIIRKKIGSYNFSHPGKFNYIQLEHEFWNINSYAYILSDSSTLTSNGIDTHFTKLFNEHLDLLTIMDTAKSNDGNVWKVFDYVAYFFNRASGAIENYSNTTARKNKTKLIGDTVDAIFTTYYQEYDTTNFGLDFIEPSSSSDFQLPRFRERLSDYGDGRIHNIIPTFSAEYYDYDTVPEIYCGFGKDTTSSPYYYYDYLGKHLDGPAFNNNYSSNDFNSVEYEYLTQHNNIIQSPPSGFSNINNVNVAGFGWLDKTLNSCFEFSYPIGSSNDILVNTKSDQNLFIVYPNPISSVLKINGKIEQVKEINLYDFYGRQVIFFQISKTSFDLSNLSKGLYILRIVENSDKIHNFKIVKQ